MLCSSVSLHSPAVCRTSVGICLEATCLAEQARDGSCSQSPSILLGRESCLPVLVLPPVTLSHIQVTLMGTSVYSHLAASLVRMGCPVAGIAAGEEKSAKDGDDRSMWVVSCAVVEDGD